MASLGVFLLCCAYLISYRKRASNYCVCIFFVFLGIYCALTPKASLIREIGFGQRMLPSVTGIIHTRGFCRHSTSLWHLPLIITQSVTELAWLKKKILSCFFYTVDCLWSDAFVSAEWKSAEYEASTSSCCWLSQRVLKGQVSQYCLILKLL